jgi:ferritin-like metal-binding protein YciE
MMEMRIREMESRMREALEHRLVEMFSEFAHTLEKGVMSELELRSSMVQGQIDKLENVVDFIDDRNQMMQHEFVRKFREPVSQTLLGYQLLSKALESSE